MKHIVMYSGGIGSWAAARRVAKKLGTENLILLFADTKIEDEDLYRFLDESAEDVGGELIKLADGRTPWEVFKDKRFLGNSRIDPCSRILKRELLWGWLEDNHDPDETVIYLGIDWTESHRLEKVRENKPQWQVEAPMCGPPYREKWQMIDELKEVGIEPPRLYKLGFPHNNCLSHDTVIITDKGRKVLGELKGQEIKVLGVNGEWRGATIRSFGEQALMRLTLSKFGSVEREFFATPDHIWFVQEDDERRLCKTQGLRQGERLVSMYPKVGDTRPRHEDWRVELVEETDRIEEVFCAVVPEGHAFTLDGNILTHNCGGICIKAGEAHFRLLYKTMPERYKFHEEKEQEIREYLDKDVAIMRDRQTRGPLTMREFRRRIEEDEENYDKCDWGGCGCFSGDYEESLPVSSLGLAINQVEALAEAGLRTLKDIADYIDEGGALSDVDTIGPKTEREATKALSHLLSEWEDDTPEQYDLLESLGVWD